MNNTSPFSGSQCSSGLYEKRSSTEPNQQRIAWRHHKPCFDTPMLRHPAARRLEGALKVHNWSRNRHIKKLRKEGAELNRGKRRDGTTRIKKIAPRRAAIRRERDETLTALVRAMIYRTDYNPTAPYLFEVQCCVEELARMIGQLHVYAPEYDGEDGQYRHGRKSCDPVHGAIEDMEAADMLFVVREFCSEAGMWKAMRIYLKPNFFTGFGFSLDDVRDILSVTKKWQEKRGFIKTAKQKRQSTVLAKAKSERIASLDRVSLQNLMTKIRREFTGEDKHTQEVMEAHNEVKRELNVRKAQQKSEQEQIEKHIYAIEQMLPRIQVITIQQDIKKQHGVNGKMENKDFLPLYLAALQAIT